MKKSPKASTTSSRASKSGASSPDSTANTPKAKKPPANTTALTTSRRASSTVASPGSSSSSSTSRLSSKTGIATRDLHDRNQTVAALVVSTIGFSEPGPESEPEPAPEAEPCMLPHLSEADVQRLIDQSWLAHALSTEANVQRMIDQSLLAWEPSAMRYKKLIDDALRVAFVERRSSVDGQSEVRKEKAQHDRVVHLGKEVESLSLEAKAAKAAIAHMKVMQLEIEELRKKEAENRAAVAALSAKLAEHQTETKHCFQEERNKRLALFNRWAHRHGDDIDKLRRSMEDGLMFLERESSAQWQTQSKCLDELREKLDIALIRRLGYLPSTTSDSVPGLNGGLGSSVNAGNTAGVAGAKEHLHGTYSSIQADRNALQYLQSPFTGCTGKKQMKQHGSRKPEAESKQAEAAGRGAAHRAHEVRSIFSRHMSPTRTHSHSTGQHRKARSSSSSYNHLGNAGSDGDSSGSDSADTVPLSAASPTRPRVGDGRPERRLSPAKVAFKNQSDTFRVELSGSTGGSYKNEEGDAYQLQYQPQYLPGLFNQGLDANNVLSSMDSRMDEMNAQIASIQQQQAQEDATDAILQERRRREKIMELEEQSFASYETYHNRYDPADSATDRESEKKLAMPNR